MTVRGTVIERRKGGKEGLDRSRSKYIAEGESSRELAETVSDKSARMTEHGASERRARKKKQTTHTISR